MHHCRRSPFVNEDEEWLSLLLLTGGDDQNLIISSLVLCCSATSAFDAWKRPCRVQWSQQIHAHSSAIRGLWSNGYFAFTIGLDQRIIRWRIGERRIEEDSCVICEVPEPNGLAVQGLSNYHCVVVVVGRGTQVVHYMDIQMNKTHD